MNKQLTFKKSEVAFLKLIVNTSLYKKKLTMFVMRFILKTYFLIGICKQSLIDFISSKILNIPEFSPFQIQQQILILSSIFEGMVITHQFLSSISLKQKNASVNDNCTFFILRITYFKADFAQIKNSTVNFIRILDQPLFFMLQDGKQKLEKQP